MELNFIKDNNKYVSEFEVSSDFNLHIERNEGGTLYIQQRTGNGQYDTVKDAVFKLGDSVIDYDFQALVYPKYIKIVSDINPIAYITSDGEVTEIKSQTKEVEVTANGTTQVAPDAGYSYLTGVTVKTNVPQSGGSGGETEYFRIDWDRLKSEFGYLPVKDYENIGAFLAKQSSILTFVTSAHFGVSTMMGMSQITPVAGLLVAVFQAPGYVDLSDIKKVAFTTFKGYDANVGSFVEMTPDYLLNGKYRDCFISITEEEFYNLG